MTNPCLHDMVKIGYASDVEARRKQLSTTALPFEYEIYATYETSGQLEDKKLHELIDTLNPKLRLAKNREFFAMSAEKTYRLLEAIAIISGSADKLKRVAQRQGETAAGSSKRQTHGSGSSGRKQRPAINFQKCGIPVGAELVFIDGRGKPRPTLTTLRFRLVTRINMVPPRLCRSRYQFAQQMSSEAVKLSAVHERGFRPACEVKTGTFDPRTTFCRSWISSSSLIFYHPTIFRILNMQIKITKQERKINHERKN